MRIGKMLAIAAVVALASFGGPVQSAGRTTPSAHGCVGFDGTWQGPGGTMHLHNGGGPYGDTTLKGTVHRNMLLGTWRHPTLGHGTFAFTLAPDGDSFRTAWTTSSHVTGSFDTVRCIGPYDS